MTEQNINWKERAVKAEAEVERLRCLLATKPLEPGVMVQIVVSSSRSYSAIRKEIPVHYVRNVPDLVHMEIESAAKSMCSSQELYELLREVTW